MNRIPIKVLIPTNINCLKKKYEGGTWYLSTLETDEALKIITSPRIVYTSVKKNKDLSIFKNLAFIFSPILNIS